MIAMATITPAELATELGTDARTARKFLRSITPRDAQPGKGSRWAIEKKAVRSMRTKFAAFEKAQAEAKALRDAAKAVEVPVEAPEALDDAADAPEGPSDAELEEIENDA
jgi:hypothetical protein